MGIATFQAQVTQVVKLGPTRKDEVWLPIRSTIECEETLVTDEVANGGLVMTVPPAPVPSPPPPAPAPSKAKAAPAPYSE